MLDELEKLAQTVRESSRAGRVVRLDREWSATESEFLNILRMPAASPFQDLAFIRDGGHVYLYSEHRMTRQFAEAAARGQCEDNRRMIAETVRNDSALYPCPTPVETFLARPFLLSPDALEAAIDEIAADSNYSDIRPVRASDGSLFLFSCNHLDPAHAAALAEWIAVESFRNL
jgi:hypothetical protein